MAQIKFEINPDTGEMSMEIEGIPGPSCQSLVDEAAELLGGPTLDIKTEEWNARAAEQARIRAGGGR